MRRISGIYARWHIIVAICLVLGFILTPMRPVSSGARHIHQSIAYPDLDRRNSSVMC